MREETRRIILNGISKAKDDKVQLKVRITRKTNDAFRQFLSYTWVKYGHGTISDVTELALIEFMQRRTEHEL